MKHIKIIVFYPKKEIRIRNIPWTVSVLAVSIVLLDEFYNFF